MAPTPGQFNAPLSTADGAIRLWTELVRGFQQAGYPQAVPQYLRLSRLLAQTRMTELLQGEVTEPAHWAAIRRLGADAAVLLRPLLESAELLAGLPTSRAEFKESSSPARRTTGSVEDPTHDVHLVQPAKSDLTEPAATNKKLPCSVKSHPEVSPPAAKGRESPVVRGKGRKSRRGRKAKRRKSTRTIKS